MNITLLDIQRMSSEDGPGLRTTAFFKGCPLSCGWCHNPESIDYRYRVLRHEERCMGCGACERACPQGLSGDCGGCGACCDACPTGAREGKGRTVSPEALCAELLKDRAYFGADGGVTLSGGECMTQPGIVELLKLLKSAGVNTAVDTCGHAPTERLEEVLPFCDVVLYDVKIADGEEHKRHTGVGNERILRNLRGVGDWAGRGGVLWVRTPIIPNATDSAENIAAIGAILSGIGGVARWELCAFNNLCAHKYKSIGREWAFADAPLIEKEAMSALLETARNAAAGVDARATGALRNNEEVKP